MGIDVVGSAGHEKEIALQTLTGYALAFSSAASAFEAAALNLALLLAMLAALLGGVLFMFVDGEAMLYGTVCFLLLVAGASVLWQLMRHHALLRREAAHECFSDVELLLHDSLDGPYAGASGALLLHALRRPAA